jgi:molybdate transport system permease protein
VSLEVHIEKRLFKYKLAVSFTVDDGPLSILGPSGSGKTMTLRCIAGLERPDAGRIVLQGRVLFDSERHVHIPARERHIGMLFQQYALFPHLTVAENIGFGLGNLTEPQRSARITKLISQTHLDDLQQRYPDALSGGERQRVALARALSMDPEALLLDEPLSALDAHLRSQIENLLQQTFESYHGITLLVTHNIEEAYRLGRQLLVMSNGKVVASGEKKEIFRHPPTLETARLTGCKNFSTARVVSEHEIEAVDWSCRLRLSGTLPRGIGHVGIRAHHIDFLESKSAGEHVNVFPCWLVRTSETPFRTTLYLRLHNPPGETCGHHLQAEVFNEKWEQFRAQPQPWHVRLDPALLFVVAD